MPRPKGTPNKPKEALSPELTKLAQVAMDTSLDAEMRAAASKALATALTPAPLTPTAPWPGYMECPCGNLFDNVEVCANCRAYLDRCRAREAAQRKAAPTDSAADLAAFDIELAAIEKDLGELGL